MTNEEIVTAIEKWQSDEAMHPLTCVFPKHKVLYAVIVNGEVRLRCRDCEWDQPVPKTFLEFLREPLT
jgi:hypothetical protein